MRLRLLATVVGLVLASPAMAGEVAIASAAAVRAPIAAMAARSEAALGERLVATYGTAGAIEQRVTGGDAVDLVVLPPARLDALVSRGLVEAEGRAPLGTVRLGLAVRSGAPRPPIASEAELRATLLAAPSIGLADPASGATTGIYFAKLLRRMELADRLTPRIRLFSDGTAAMEALARGEVALAMGQISEIRPVAGTDLVGPLPSALQLETVYAAGIAARAPHPSAARAALAFLRSDEARRAFLVAGFDPPP